MSEREQFETAYRQEFGKRWVCPQRQDMFKRETNRYAHLSVQDMWVMWQAARAQPAQAEAVRWGVDWGTHGDRTCVSIIKKHEDGTMEVVATEYEPERKTAPQQAEAVPSDVARDAERWRTFLATRPANTHAVINDAIDAVTAKGEKS